MTEEDLLRRILQDFGVISREEVKAGRIAHVTKQELIDALYDFLLGLIPIKASAVLIIDEAQNLPLRCSSRSGSFPTSRPTRKSCCRSSSWAS